MARIMLRVIVMVMASVRAHNHNNLHFRYCGFS